MITTLMQPLPVANPIREVLHGIEVEDRFRWLEDQDAPATRSFIRAEQEAYQEYLSNHGELRGLSKPALENCLRSRA